MGRIRLTIEDMHKVAEKRGGKCLSNTYITNNYKLKWQCSKGHIWKARPREVKNSNRWCHQCRKIPIEKLHHAAKENGGLLLSNMYTNINDKYTWKCATGHIWDATGASIMYSKSWCPYCCSFMSENICRMFFEKMFNNKFKKCRPKNFVSSSGGILELDGYCEELGIAFEHNGMQHYEIGHFNNDNKIKIRDYEKIKLCNKYGIKLIVIPQLFKIIKLNELQNFIYNECNKLNINIKNNNHININEMNIGNFRKNILELEKIKNIAINNNGICLSDVYINRKTKMKFKCKNNHVWETNSYVILKGSWCKKCSLKKIIKHTIEEAHNIAINRGGKCLSKKYINYSTKLKFQCKNKHIWLASFDSIIHNRWCRKCYYSKLTKR